MILILICVHIKVALGDYEIRYFSALSLAFWESYRTR